MNVNPRCFAVLSAAAAALLGVGRMLDEGTRRQPPKLVFRETTHDLGHVDAGRQLTAAFPFRNTGGLDLSIDNVRAACNCTAAVPDTRVIPPGSTGAIDVTFDTTGEHGHAARTITVYSNDPLQPVTTLTLNADVDAALAAEPAELYVGHLRRGAAAWDTVRLVGPEVRALGAIETPGSVLEASLDGAPGKPPAVRVAIKPRAPLGRFKESVLVHTQNSRQPPLAIPVVGFVDPEAPAAMQRH